MSDREPVNIMGVIAFPNPDHDKRMIRFIDSEYHTLFTIKDGESIVITRFDGEKMVFPCKYIDDCHVCIGNSAYHICEFAEMQERSGNTYVPRTPKISAEIGTYEIYQIPATADVDYYFRPYYEVAGAEPHSVIVLKQPFGDIPAGKKLLWVCGDRGFHCAAGVFGGELKCSGRLRVIPVEAVLNGTDDPRMEGLDFDSPAPSENAYMKRYSVANYAHRMRAGLAR